MTPTHQAQTNHNFAIKTSNDRIYGLFIYDSIGPKDFSKKIIGQIKGWSSCKSDTKKKYPSLRGCNQTTSWQGSRSHGTITSQGWEWHHIWVDRIPVASWTSWTDAVVCIVGQSQLITGHYVTVCKWRQQNKMSWRYMLQNTGDVTYLLSQKQEQVANKQLLLMMAALLECDLKVT